MNSTTKLISIVLLVAAASTDAFSPMPSAVTGRRRTLTQHSPPPLHYSDDIDRDNTSSSEEHFYDVATGLPIIKQQVSPIAASSQLEISAISLQESIHTGTVSEPPPSSSSSSSSTNTAAATGKKMKAETKNNKTGSSKKKKVSRGLFAPVVLLAKMIVGERRLGKLRGRIIGLHSDVIAKFTKTGNTTEFGKNILKLLFDAADTDGNGVIDRRELTGALRAVGFTDDFLKEKQIAGIFARADTNNDGILDIDEFIEQAPKVLKNNLTKLAKRNGTEMGLMV